MNDIAKLMRFGMVGAATALVYALILWGLVEAAGWRPAAGAALAYVLAVVFNYLAHHVWTYRTDRPHRSAGPRYLLLIAGVFLLNVLATALLPGLLGVSYVTVQLGLAALMVVVTFTLQNRWVFSRYGDSSTDG